MSAGAWDTHRSRDSPAPDPAAAELRNPFVGRWWQYVILADKVSEVAPVRSSWMALPVGSLP